MLHYCLIHGEFVCLAADLPKQTKFSNKEQSKNIRVCVCVCVCVCLWVNLHQCIVLL